MVAALVATTAVVGAGGATGVGVGAGAGVVGVPVAEVPTPTAVHAAADHLYVTSWAPGAVVRFAILPGGLLGPAEPVVTSGISNPLGVVVADDGTVFVADSHAGGDAYDGRTIGRVQAVGAGGLEVVVDGLPNGRHNTNNLAIHDGRLYITNGNATDDGVNGGDPELPLSGTLVSVPLTTRDLVIGPSGGKAGRLMVEGTGMRNLYDVAFRPGTDEAWITTNGPDQLDPYGEDTLVKVPDVGRGAPDFGFPNCLYNADGEILDNPNTGTCGPHRPPEELLGLHVSADGLAFGPDDDFWQGDLFIAEFGSFFGDEVAGHKVVRVPIDDAGNSAPPEDFITGVTPLDLTFGAAGMYVADFGAGTITLYVPAG
jgi:glucose/arabinose dehydrogenase